MSEMVKRVAAAIVAKMAEPSPRKETAQDIALQIARAAIEAMREPTAEMLFVGSNDEAGFTQRNLLQSWHLMVDEALALPQASRDGAA